jgi:hypothetical protein
MENFTNETIDTTQLPRFEYVPYTPYIPQLESVTHQYWSDDVGLRHWCGRVFFQCPGMAGYETKVVGGLLILFALILFFCPLGFF